MKKIEICVSLVKRTTLISPYCPKHILFLTQAILMSFNGRLPNDSRIDVPFTSFEMDVAVAIYAVGGMFGALPAGYLADLIGR